MVCPSIVTGRTTPGRGSPVNQYENQHLPDNLKETNTEASSPGGGNPPPTQGIL